VIVDSVYPGSPADKAGLQPHDVITEIDGRKVSSGNELQDYIVERPVGSSVRLGFLREGRNQTATVAIGDRNEVLAGESAVASANAPTRPSPRGDSEASSRLGITVEPISQQLRRQFGLRGGVVISSVEEGSVAEEAGLSEDMVITGAVMERRVTEINSVADFRTLEARLRSGTSVVLQARIPPTYQRDIPFSMKAQ
jgi:serine protease Do